MRTQLKMNLYKGQRGGRRPGAGRKRLQSRGVAHEIRERVNQRTPLHINFKYRLQIRNKDGFKLLKRAIRNARGQGLRILHYSLQSNHIHLLVEATSNDILTRGMRSLTVTFAKGLKKGRVQIERYHLHVLRTLRETRNALHYVLFNEQKHRRLKTAYINQYSSLGTVRDLGRLAQESNFTIVLKRLFSLIELDSPLSWLMRASLSHVARNSSGSATTQ